MSLATNTLFRYLQRSHSHLYSALYSSFIFNVNPYSLFIHLVRWTFHAHLQYLTPCIFCPLVEALLCSRVFFHTKRGIQLSTSSVLQMVPPFSKLVALESLSLPVLVSYIWSNDTMLGEIHCTHKQKLLCAIPWKKTDTSIFTQRAVHRMHLLSPRQLHFLQNQRIWSCRLFHSWRLKVAEL